jgi:hypothetical protein
VLFTKFVKAQEVVKQHYLTNLDTIYIEYFREGGGITFLKKIPTEEGLYIVYLAQTKTVLMIFNVNKEGELCGDLFSFNAIGNLVATTNYCKCQFDDTIIKLSKSQLIKEGN